MDRKSKDLGLKLILGYLVGGWVSFHLPNCCSDIAFSKCCNGLASGHFHFFIGVISVLFSRGICRGVLERDIQRIERGDQG